MDGCGIKPHELPATGPGALEGMCRCDAQNRRASSTTRTGLLSIEACQNAVTGSSSDVGRYRPRVEKRGFAPGAPRKERTDLHVFSGTRQGVLRHRRYTGRQILIAVRHACDELNGGIA